MFCCTLLCVRSSIAIILVGKREPVALLNLSSWCLVMVEQLFLAMPQGCLRFVKVVFPDHTHLLFLVSVEREVRAMKCLFIYRRDLVVCHVVFLAPFYISFKYDFHVDIYIAKTGILGRP